MLPGSWMAVVHHHTSEWGPSISTMLLSKLCSNGALQVTYSLHWLCPIHLNVAKDVRRDGDCLIWNMIIHMLEINLGYYYLIHDLNSDIQMTLTIKECHRPSIMALWRVCIFLGGTFCLDVLGTLISELYSLSVWIHSLSRLVTVESAELGT